jgi:ABC-2 type transport system permease protein
MINPQHYFIDILRGVFLKGSGFNALWQPMLALAVIGTVLLGASVLRFRKTLE